MWRLRLRRLHRLRRARGTPLQRCWQQPLPSTSSDWRQVSFLVCDAEMSSLEPATGELLSLGWVAVEHGGVELGSARHHLIQAVDSVGQSATVHQLRDCELADAQSIEDVMAAFLAAAAGRVLVFHNAFLDMASQIRRQISQLEDNDRLRRELVSNISHDLRTPLSATQGYLETLLIRGKSLSSTDRRHYLTIARHHLIRLGNLITDLFELSKLDAAGISPNLEEFPLAELVQDVAQEFQLEAENKGVNLSMALGTGGAVTVGDIGLIQRALENLMRNAIHFTPAGGTVTLSIVESPQALNVAVSDTGPGIPERDLPRIFDRFYRSESGEEARADASGLGLAIAKRILDLHNSQIRVTSRVDAGTRFEFQLPLTQRVA